MAGTFTRAAEVIDGSDNAATDEVMPHAVGKDSRGELARAGILGGVAIAAFNQGDCAALGNLRCSW